VLYFQHMKEHEFDERFDRLEKTVNEGFARVDERFAQVTSRMEAGFAHVNSLILSILSPHYVLANLPSSKSTLPRWTGALRSSTKRLKPSLTA
jgi:hypothetical protein